MQSLMYLPENTPSRSISPGVNAGVKFGSKSLPGRATKVYWYWVGIPDPRAIVSRALI